MCEAQEIRYVFHMWHPDYPDILEVGCECAEMMGPDGGEALRRLRQMRNRAARRRKWLKRKWKVSHRGNPILRTNGYRVTIWRKGARWSFTVAHEDADPTTPLCCSRHPMRPSWRPSISSGLQCRE
jgi:hypothetical protein